ncbi:hypothetical protein SLEP1_g44118 [Rubroshorea leprosula]|uniref:Integrase catalytic domain-containing protein n=1 Tax=Rubroshorea leprosula TaxID=152421 RepID=A0AAV5LF73_9ROSI|nr:hypothetical protein SLEP1_g44118 [Rubroshorea leprosula]
MQSLPTSKDRTKYYDFHQDHDHTIEECNSLKSKLEGLVLKGMLNEFIPNKDHPKFAPPSLPTPARIIHMINGGLEAGRMSSKQQELYVREVKHQNQAQKKKFDDEEWKNQQHSHRLTSVASLHPIVTRCSEETFVQWGEAASHQRGGAKTFTDKLVEVASGNERLSLLDAYSGYHQVHMTSEDEVKTSFYAGDEIYGYVKTPFRLKNAGATYPKMVTIVFQAQIAEIWRGIEVNLENIKAIEEMKLTRSTKDVQRLTRRVAALHRFIFKSTDKCLPFFKVLRTTAQRDKMGKPKKFDWTADYQTTFDELKAYLNSPPLLTKAEEGEILYLYLGISDTIVDFAETRMLRKTHQMGSGAGGVPDNIPIEVSNLSLVSRMKCHFENFQLTKVLRAENEHEDSLLKLASDSSGGYMIPNQIIADNGLQFNYNSFKDLCSSYGIKLVFTSVYHLETNGMVESVNKAILEGIKLSLRVSHFEPTQNEQLFRENLDFLDEVREQSQFQTLAYKQKVARFYNKWVRPRSFRIDDLVLRRVGLIRFKTHFSKLAPNWEGPYIVTEIPHPSAYILQYSEGKRVPRIWNVNNLKKLYL